VGKFFDISFAILESSTSAFRKDKEAREKQVAVNFHE